MKFTEEFGEWIVPGAISVAIHVFILLLAFGTRGCGDKSTKEPVPALEDRTEETVAGDTRSEVASEPDSVEKPSSTRPGTNSRPKTGSTTKPRPGTNENKPKKHNSPPAVAENKSTESKTGSAGSEGGDWEYHLVQKGEFLSKIVDKIAGSDDKELKNQVQRRILELNPGLKPNLIQVGQKIKVPKKAE